MEVQSPETLQQQAQQPFKILGIHHVEFFVGNAKQAAYFYRRGFGFEWFAYSGLETGNRNSTSYALRQNEVVFVLTAPYHSNSPIYEFLQKHGDGVRDIAFLVDDAEKAYETTTARGAESVVEPHVVEDENGQVKIATVRAYGDIVHSFIEKGDYQGVFLPGFQGVDKDPIADPVGFVRIDHIVGNMGWNQMEEMVNFYNRVFGFKRFVSFDDKDISTEYTALRSTVVANDNLLIKFPINEPAEGKKKSQIEEFVEFNEGPGVQHIALLTNDIVTTVEKLRANGIEFMDTPDAYYDTLPSRVGAIDEAVDTIRRLRILVDRDDQGYLLQIFTRTLVDRPTLFFEIIQRKGAQSFGKGNFKALFEAIEREQALRGTLDK